MGTAARVDDKWSMAMDPVLPFWGVSRCLIMNGQFSQPLRKRLRAISSLYMPHEVFAGGRGASMIRQC